MAKFANPGSDVFPRWVVRLLALCLLVPAPVRADEAESPDPATLLPRARQLQREGNLRTAEYLADYEVKHHRTQRELAGGLEVLTSIYRQAGRWDEALTTAQQYQQVLEKIPNADASKRQDSQLLLAEILADLQRYAEAAPHVDESLKIADGWRTIDVLWEPHALAVRARIEQAAGQSEAAEADWREVEARVVRVLDRISPFGTNVDLEETALKLLTDALVATHRTAEAITLREQFLARQLDDQVRARNWSEVARLWGLLGEDKKEEHALGEALALEPAGVGERSAARRADLIDRLGLALKHQGRGDEARGRWEEAATMYQNLLEQQGSRRHRAERQLVNLARLQLVYERLNRWTDAIETQERLLKQRAENWLLDDPRLWRLKGTLAALYVRTGDTEKARALLHATLDYWQRRVPRAPNETALTLIEMSKLARQEHDLKNARDYATEATEAWRQAPAGHELRQAEALDNLADVLVAQRQYRSAVERYRQAIEICRQLPQDRHATQLQCGMLVDIARIYKSQQQYQRAAEYCATALAVRQKAPGKDPPALIGLYLALATLQLADEGSPGPGGGDHDRQLAEAEANIAAARQLCRQQGSLEGPTGIGVLELEAVVDVRRQQPAQARRTLDKALDLSRRQHRQDLEAKIRTQLAGLQQPAGEPAKAESRQH